MPHATISQSRLPRASRLTRKHRAGPNSGLETFAIRFAELALLAGVVGAGIALLVTRAG
jgi:hypothetical protein